MNQPEKPDYVIIQETLFLLTPNMVSTKCPLGGGQNGYLGLFLTDAHYSLVSAVTFILLQDLNQTSSNGRGKTAPQGSQEGTFGNTTNFWW